MNLPLIFRNNWVVMLIWGLALYGVHVLSYAMHWSDTPFKGEWINKIGSFGGENFVATITKILAGFYAFGMPLILAIFQKKLDELESVFARNKLVRHKEITFFVTITPVFICYSIIIQYFSQYNDLHAFVLLIISLYLLYKIYSLARLCLAIFYDVDQVLLSDSQKDINEIFDGL